MSVHALGIVTLAFAALSSTACGGASTSPKATLHEYAEALKEGETHRAYQLMSAEYRANHSEEEFALMFTSNRAEAKETASRLDLGNVNIAVGAELTYGLDEKLRLIKEKGQWRVATNPLDFYSQDTPRDTVRSFVRAYRLKRWEVMLRMVPVAYRERMTPAMVKSQFQGARQEAMSLMMERLELNLHLARSEKQQGNEARLRYGDSEEVELVREDGLWMIKAL